MRRAVRAVVLAALGMVVLAVGWVWLASRAPERSEPARVLVERGTPVRALAVRLEQAEVVRSARLFELWVRAAGDAGSIQAGTYEIPAGASLASVVDMLRTGRTLLASVTIPEGLRLEQQAGVAARQLGIDSAAFVAAATDSLLADSLGVDATTL